MESNSTIFHLPFRKSLSAFLIAIWLPIFLVVPDDYLFSINFMGPVLVIVIVNILISLIGVWYISKLVISDEGMILYKVNKVAWDDVINACSTKFLGIKSIKIKRRKGLTWYLPLYMVGETTIKEALINHAPQNNTLYKVANELQIT
jgi:hypothetical protein